MKKEMTTVIVVVAAIAVFAWVMSASGPTPAQWDEFWAMGDANRDGYINDLDMELLTAAYMSTPSDGHWDPRCDFDSDSDVDFDDQSILAFNHGKNIWDHFGIEQG
jgi:hypothetical protein